MGGEHHSAADPGRLNKFWGPGASCCSCRLCCNSSFSSTPFSDRATHKEATKTNESNRSCSGGYNIMVNSIICASSRNGHMTFRPLRHSHDRYKSFMCMLHMLKSRARIWIPLDADSVLGCSHLISNSCRQLACYTRVSDEVREPVDNSPYGEL